MKTKIFNITALLITVQLFSGCEKVVKPCSEEKPPVLEVTLPSLDDRALQIKVTGTGENEVASYIWRGPKRFQNRYSNAHIENPDASNSGVYQVDVAMNNGCIFTLKTDSLDLSKVTIPCNTTGKRIEFSDVANGPITRLFNHTAGAGAPTNVDMWFTETSGMRIVCPTWPPAAGKYPIGENTTIKVYWYTNDGAQLYPCTSGTLHVTRSGTGSVSYLMCNGKFRYNAVDKTGSFSYAP